MAKLKEWVKTCQCGARFYSVLEFGEHMAVHPVKCNRCKGWFGTIDTLINHYCKPVKNMED